MLEEKGADKFFGEPALALADLMQVDFSGNGVSMAQLTGGLNRLGLVLAGPTTDYGETSFGSDVTTRTWDTVRKCTAV